MLINPDTPRPERSGSTVFYRSADITVTSQYVQISDNRLKISDLRDVVCALGYAYPACKVALATGAIELALSAGLTIASRSLLMACTGALAVVGVMTGALVDAHRNPRVMELWGTCRGHVVMLYRSNDHTEFGRVHRALLRAMEIGSEQGL
jgi:hypothetical protein